MDDIIGAMSPSNPDHDDAFETLAVHAGAEPDELTGAVSPPIYQTSTYAQDGVNNPRRGHDYARSINPTRDRLERAVAALEKGTHGIAFASGSAATAAIAQLAAAGEEIVVGDDVYGGTYRYLERVHRPGGAAEARYVDLSAGPDVLWEQLTAATRLVWFETPSNPNLKLTDIAAASRTIRDRAAQAGTTPPLLVVDTFCVWRRNTKSGWSNSLKDSAKRTATRCTSNSVGCARIWPLVAPRHSRARSARHDFAEPDVAGTAGDRTQQCR